VAKGEPLSAALGAATRPGRRRILIYGLLFAMSALNYGDRAALSVGAPAIAREFALTPVQVGYLLSSFLWTYFLLNLPAGLISDRFGARRCAGFSVALWSAATALTGATFSLWFLIATRMLLGIGEAFGFPVGNRAIREWAPRTERGFATAVFSSGQAFGTAATAIGAAWLITITGWRTAFVCLGLIGFAWVAAWFVFYRDPHRTWWLSPAEREVVLRGRDITPEARGLSVAELFRWRSTWGLIGVQICANFTNFLLLTWLPGYLVMSRHADVMHSGIDTAICYMLACVMTIAIGALADRILGPAAVQAGKRRGLVAILLVGGSVMVLAPLTDSHLLLLTLTTISIACIQSALAMNYALTSDLLRQGQGIGTLIGLLLTFSNGFGILAPILTGYIVAATGRFDAAFDLAAALVLIGATLAMTATRRPIG
jgi:ACS family glucarate transporter-like MFS transporter